MLYVSIVCVKMLDRSIALATWERKQEDLARDLTMHPFFPSQHAVDPGAKITMKHVSADPIFALLSLLQVAKRSALLPRWTGMA
jgi:hypothetical protein